MITKLIFLGSAQDGGVPQAGCHCDNCRDLSIQAASIALIDGEGATLIDVTPDFRTQYRLLTRKGVERLNSVYLTHAHWGHYGGLMQLGNEGWNVKDLPVYLSRRFFDYLSSNQPFASLFEADNLVPEIVQNGKPTKAGLTPHKVPHRDEYSDTFGFSFSLNGKRVLYLPCLDEFTVEIRQMIRSHDLSIIDGTFYDDNELPGRDMSRIPHPRVSESMKEFADIADRIIFTHLNHSNPLLYRKSVERIRFEEAGFRLAFDGMEVE